MVANSPLRVGLVTPGFPPAIGGANLYCFELARALSCDGLEVHVFTKPGSLEDASFVVHPILTGSIARDLSILRNWDMDLWHALFFQYAALALEKPNVFVTGHGDDCFNYKIGFDMPGQKLLTEHIRWRLKNGARARFDAGLRRTRNAWNSRYYKAAISRVRRLITVSSFTAEQLVKRFPQAREKVTVIPPGVAERFFQATRDSHFARKRLLTVTRLDEHDRIKNVHNVVKALTDLKPHYDFSYTIVAGGQYGSYRNEIERLIIDGGLQDRVQIEGRVSDEALVRCYAGADLFVLASYAEPDNFEGFGIVFLEANATGTPVLTSREGGMRDYVKEGENGFYVPDVSARGIRGALVRFLSGAITFDIERVRGAPELYRWSHIAERVRHVYERYGLNRATKSDQGRITI